MLSFYGGAFLTCLIAGLTLAILGQHLFLRKETLQVFSLSQILLLFFLFLSLLFPDTNSFIKVSLGFGLLVMIRLFIPTSIINKDNSDLVMVGVYIFFLSLQYFFLSLFPGLDSIHSFALFGSVVTLSLPDNLFVILSFFVFLIIYFVSRRQFTKETLEAVFFDKKISFSLRGLLFPMVIVISLFYLGQIYTLSFILLPYLFLSRSFSTQRGLIFFISFINVIAGVTGLALSLHYERLSTVPTQVFVLVILLFIVFILVRKKKFKYL